MKHLGFLLAAAVTTALVALGAAAYAVFLIALFADLLHLLSH